MFKINKDSKGNLLSFNLVRGDTASYICEVFDPSNNQPCSFKTGDSAEFLVRKFYSDTNNLITIQGTCNVNTDVISFNLQGTESLNLELGNYICQVVLTLADGTKHTIVTPCFDRNNREIPNFVICGNLDSTSSNSIPNLGTNYKNIQDNYPYVFKGLLNYPVQSALVIESNDHSKLSNLDYESSKHTGFAKSPDSTLLTTDKTLSGAINELYNKIESKIPQVINGGNPFVKGTVDIDGGTHNTIYTSGNIIDSGGV